MEFGRTGVDTKNVEDAIDYFNDTKYVENLGIGIGMILGSVLRDCSHRSQIQEARQGKA